MKEFVDPLVFWAAAIVQMLGLASVLFARLPRRTKSHEYARGIYLGCLVVLGLATMVAIGSGSGYWAWCGTTFSLMAVGGTFDQGPSFQPDAF
jgi:cadmium resistance protein CadD (predicted permease)